jgi:hypothetical protein
MSADPPAAPREFDVSVENAPKAGTQVVEGQAENEDEKRKLDAALASTYDPARTHDGKTDEELIEERDHEARLIVDVAIVTGVIVAHEAAVHHEHSRDEAAPAVHDHGDSD